MSSASWAVDRSGDQSRSSSSGPYCPAGTGMEGSTTFAQSTSATNRPLSSAPAPAPSPAPAPAPSLAPSASFVQPPFRFDLPKLKP